MSYIPPVRSYTSTYVPAYTPTISYAQQTPQVQHPVLYSIPGGATGRNIDNDIEARLAKLKSRAVEIMEIVLNVIKDINVGVDEFEGEDVNIEDASTSLQSVISLLAQMEPTYEQSNFAQRKKLQQHPQRQYQATQSMASGQAPYNTSTLRY